MLHIDVPKVRGKMAEHGYNITSMAQLLGISRNTLTSYLSAPEKFPYSVVSDMANILCDTNEEAAEIFFAPDLRFTKGGKEKSGYIENF